MTAVHPNKFCVLYLVRSFMQSKCHAGSI